MKKTIFIGIIILLAFPAAILAQETTVAPSVPATQVAPAPISEPQIMPVPQEPKVAPAPREEELNKKEEQRDEEYVDPREIKNTLQQIKDLRRQANQLLKKAKKAKMANEIEQLNQLFAKAADFEKNIKNPPADMSKRDAIQDFHDEQLWEIINAVRAKVEMPDEIKNIERDLKRLERRLAQKKLVFVEGFNIESVKAIAQEIKDAIAQARESLAQGDYESARESLQVIYEGSHPGEIMGVLDRLRDMGNRLRGIKAKDIRSDILEILAPVIESANAGDFRDANMMLNDIQNEFWRFLDKLGSRSVINEDLRQRMDALEEKLQQRSQQTETKEAQPVPQKESMNFPYKPYRSASVVGNAYNGVLNFLGL